MKRKKANQKKTKTQPALPVKPLSDLRIPKRVPVFWSEQPAIAPSVAPDEGTHYWTAEMRIAGIEVPPDLELAIVDHGGETFLWMLDLIEKEPWRFFERFAVGDGQRYYERHLGGDDWEGIDLGNPASWTKDERGKWKDYAHFGYVELSILHAAISTAMAQGFFLALLRYADELKHVPEAVAIRAALERGRKKGAAVVRQKAAPKKTAIRKRFRELRKSGFTKTDARKVLEQDTGFSFRQIERDTKGLA